MLKVARINRLAASSQKMREKNYSTGLRGVLFEAKHYERMGTAIWLYGWLVLRQTHQSGTVGWVLGGAPIHYREIQEETGFAPKTLERWMRSLREQGYIETQATPRGLVVRILKAKKFAQRFPQAARKSAALSPKFEDGSPQNCAPASGDFSWNQTLAARISRSFIEKSKVENLRTLISTEIRKQLQQQTMKATCLRKTENHYANATSRPRSPEAEELHSLALTNPSTAQQDELRLTKREFFELIRAEREDSLRRELNVGAGPR